MTLSIDILNTDVEITKHIYSILRKEINKRIVKNSKRVQRTLKSMIRGWIEQSPEVASLLSQGVPGSLNALFGLPPGSARGAIEAIINSVENALEVRVGDVSTNLTGEVVFNFQEESLTNLIALPEGHQITELGTDLHWLDWLLKKGDTTIIKGFFYEPSNAGRSGGGTMKMGGMFRVPPEFAGVDGNNFITKAFIGKEKQISNALNQIFV